MPCFCAEAYNTNDLVTFSCGHMVHSFCASEHIAHRLNKDDDDDDDEEVDVDKYVSFEKNTENISFFNTSFNFVSCFLIFQSVMPYVQYTRRSHGSCIPRFERN